MYTFFFFGDMQSLLDIALRSTAAAADPCHEDLTCSVVSDQLQLKLSNKICIISYPSVQPFYCQERSSLLKRMATLKGVEIKTSSDSVDLEQPVSITGLETFSLSYKVCSFSFPFEYFLLVEVMKYIDCQNIMHIILVIFKRNYFLPLITCKFVGDTTLYQFDCTIFILLLNIRLLSIIFVFGLFIRSSGHYLLLYQEKP